MQVLNNPEVGAEIMAVIDPIRDRLFAEARAEGRREPTEAYAADALTTLAREAGATTTDTGPNADSDGESGHDSGAGGLTSATVLRAESAATPASATTFGTAPTAETGATDDSASASTAASVVASSPVQVRCSRQNHWRVDLPALLRGYPVSGEVAEMVGYGPVSVSVIRDMIDSGDPFLTAVATGA